MAPRRAAPLRIACLHGYCENAASFRADTAALRPLLEGTVRRARRALSGQADDAAGETPDNNCNDEEDDDDEAEMEMEMEMEPLAQLIYLNGPFVFTPRRDARPRKRRRTRPVDQFDASFSPAPPDAPAPETRSWWAPEDTGTRYEGWDATLGELRTVFKEHRFDGVLGFSQGAVVAALLCALSAAGAPELRTLRFAVLFSGAASRDTRHAHMFRPPGGSFSDSSGSDSDSDSDEESDAGGGTTEDAERERRAAAPAVRPPALLPHASLHVWGTRDRFMRPAWSAALAACFEPRRRRVVRHASGHRVLPCPTHDDGDGADMERERRELETVRRAVAEFVLARWDERRAATAARAARRGRRARARGASGARGGGVPAMRAAAL